LWDRGGDGDGVDEGCVVVVIIAVVEDSDDVGVTASFNVALVVVPTPDTVPFPLPLPVPIEKGCGNPGRRAFGVVIAGADEGPVELKIGAAVAFVDGVVVAVIAVETGTLPEDDTYFLW
jgi:hypothetical protein